MEYNRREKCIRRGRKAKEVYKEVANIYREKARKAKFENEFQLAREVEYEQKGILQRSCQSLCL